MAEEMAKVKPICGADKADTGEYDLPLHVAAVFMVFAASIFGAGFPVTAKKVRWLKIPPKVFFACKHFGTGVLIATAFVHLLPTAFFSLSNPCLPDLFTDDYPPLPGVIMMTSLFCLFVIEMYLNAKTGGHSHGGPTGSDLNHGHSHGHSHAAAAPSPPRPPRYNTTDDFEADQADFEKRMAQQMYDQENKVSAARRDPFVDSEKGYNADSEMPAWFVVFYEQYVRQRLEMMNMIRETETNQSRQIQAASSSWKDPNSEPRMAAVKANMVAPPGRWLDENGQVVDPLVYRKMSLNITMLEGGILFHSVFVGMTISITNQGFIILLVAILFHQMFEGLGLGSRIAAVPYPPGSFRPWLLVIAFGSTAPIGQAIGLAARNSYDPDSAFGLIIVGVFNAISSGLLIYAALVDLLAEDFLSEEAQAIMTTSMKITAFCYVLLGALGMSIVGAFA
ncbi:hypothetical protein RB595_002912 [Gaeumannomyces hyphopodioides]